jgi:hypothetical protein
MVAKKISRKESGKETSANMPVQSVKNNVSIILGVLSILISFVLPYGVAITGVLGLIFAYIEKGKVSKRSNLWAFVLNLVGVFLAIVVLTVSFLAVLLYSSQLNLTGAA